MRSTGFPQEGVEFIKRELLPEMVHNRCFCENGSREFVEFESASVEPFVDEGQNEEDCPSYVVRLVLRFSAEPREFPLFVKMLPGYEDERAFRAFQNEEMFYSKMIACYNLDDQLPRSYASDLGKYGRPILVLEDLRAIGYQRCDSPLDANHLQFCLKALASFHAGGIQLKDRHFPTFREFEAKLQRHGYPLSTDNLEISPRIAEALGSISDVELREEISRNLKASPSDMEKRLTVEKENDGLRTICHGDFSQRNVLFKYVEGKPIDAKLVGWQKMKLSSPAVDLAGILQPANLTAESALTTLQETLTTYFETLKRQCSRVTWAQFKGNVVAELPSTCVILSQRTDSTKTEELLFRLLRRLADFN